MAVSFRTAMILTAATEAALDWEDRVSWRTGAAERPASRVARAIINR